MKSGIFCFPFFTALKIPFLPLRLAFMDTSPGLWCRPTTNPPLDSPSPEPQLGGARVPVSCWKKWPVPEPGGAFMPKKPHFHPKPDGDQGDRKSLGGALTNTTDSRKTGSHGDIIPDCYSLHLLHQLCRLLPFLNSLIGIISSSFMLNMVKGHCLSLAIALHYFNISVSLT